MEPDYNKPCEVVTVELPDGTGGVQYSWKCLPHLVGDQRQQIGDVLKNVIEHAYNAGSAGAMVAMMADLDHNANRLRRKGDTQGAEVLHDMRVEMLQMLGSDDD